MTGLRYFPLHVTEFCGEMQGKFKVGLARLITICNLHWCFTFCTGVTLFALVLHLNCTALSQSESSNIFMYIINKSKKCMAMSETQRSDAIHFFVYFDVFKSLYLSQIKLF